MPIYRYTSQSAVDEVSFIRNETKGIRAYIHADKAANRGELERGLKYLKDSGYLVVPMELDGKPVLEIRGFDKEEELLGDLTSQQLIRGEGSKADLPSDKISFLQKMKKNSLFASAALYLAGDVAFIAYEHKVEAKKKQKEAEAGTENAEKRSLADQVWGRVAGYGYLAGSGTSLVSMLLKKDASEDEITKTAQSIVTSAKAAGIAIGDDATINYASKDTSDTSIFRRTFTKYPAELMNLSFATAGLAIARGAYKDLKEFNEMEKLDPSLKNSEEHTGRKSVRRKDILLGVGTVLSGTVSSFVKEHQPDPDKPKAKGIARVWEYLREKPLRIAGYGYLVSTAIHLVSSLQERFAIIKGNKERAAKGLAPEDYSETSARLFFVISNLIAEVIMTFSSKGHGAGVKSDESIDTTTAAMVAELIHSKPASERATLVAQMSEFLSKPDALNTTKEKAQVLLESQLSKLEHNPWVAVANVPALTKVTPETVEAPVPTAGQVQDVEQAPQATEPRAGAHANNHHVNDSMGGHSPSDNGEHAQHNAGSRSQQYQHPRERDTQPNARLEKKQHTRVNAVNDVLSLASPS